MIGEEDNKGFEIPNQVQFHMHNSCYRSSNLLTFCHYQLLVLAPVDRFYKWPSGAEWLYSEKTRAGPKTGVRKQLGQILNGMLHG